jgi:hypothetical protein
MIQWRVYGEGWTFDSTMGGPQDVPAVGVVSIKQRNDCDHHPTTWMKAEALHNVNAFGTVYNLLEGADHYWWREDKQCWFRGDLLGFLDQAMHCGAQYLKQGRYLTHEDWEKLVRVVQDDPDFPH